MMSANPDDDYMSLAEVKLSNAAVEIDRLTHSMAEIAAICRQTHAGHERAYTALSRIDQIARKALTL